MTAKEVELGLKGAKVKVVSLALIISAAVTVAILSLPEFIEPLARSIISSMGPYWLLAVFVVGVVHGLKPDEHTWPITVSYGLMQRDVRGVVAAVSVFAGALTLIWTLMSALVGQVIGLLQTPLHGPVVDIAVGITMVGVAAYLVFSEHENSGEVKTADYKMIWIHGLAAAFGGDFFIVLVMATILVPVISSGTSFLVGLMFSLGSWAAQLAVVVLIYKGVFKGLKDWQLVSGAARFALGILGLFMIGLGIYSLLYPRS
ncbi:MAG: hypothetical protein ACP5HK_03475 [Acidilobus sp.]